MFSDKLGIISAGKVMGYEKRLFDTDRVHTVDIVASNWDTFIETCENEEYTEISVVIDGEGYKNVGIRAKGNTSLSSVRSMNSDRYSFKIEFDHYDSTKSYYGLDKLSLNNLIQDNTMMKDYLVYRLMNEMGVSAPLCSFVYITVNGEDWGLYLAVEGVEDGFLERNYNSRGELYKPDSMSMGGGRGNGRDFDMDDFMNQASSENDASATAENRQGKSQFGNFDPSQMKIPEGFDPSQAKNNGGGFGGFGGGMGSNDVKLKYIDDDPESYPNIFSNAKTDVTDSDSARLIQALKALSEGERIEEVVDIEAVIRYFAVHDYVVNGDSYTGTIIHNYYLHENDGKLSMIPWDYNLAFGSFQSSNASSSVNSPIDTPVSSGNMSDRPMVAWIFQNEEYTELYHNTYRQLVEGVDIDGIIASAYSLIKPYVEKDPSKFCTVEEFEKGVETLRAFCELRTESVLGQLNGTIPSTRDEQSKDSSSLVKVTGLNLGDMGSMGRGGFGGGDRNNPFGNRGNQSNSPSNEKTESEEAITPEATTRPQGMTRPQGSAMPEGMTFPEGMTRPNTNEGWQMPEGMTKPNTNEGWQMPEGMTRPDNFGRQDFTQAPNQNQQANKSTIITLCSCFALLACALVVVKLYKR